MRLSKIKLAGFKSFVDPTTIDFPSNLNGIVGPNGCGKSNTIDAVRWVMGESSAKHLRGASMSDVIFSGSSSRKPVSQASVELVFDNSQGKLEGPYASYTEVAAKRLVTRDGQSKYFLNGSKCRRRDIADLFLGTGLGPRSYAIIEQGMISRLIDAKPEELRSFLEEAAGISKYKERRRETETRIRHTRENLERLTDLREEIEKQLERLQRQSRTAEKYKALKLDERRLKAEHLALRWRELHQQMENREQAIEEQETRLQAIIAQQRAVESELETLREQRVEQNESLNAVQARFYTLGTEISRIEQTIQHEKEMLSRQQNDLNDLESALNEIQQSLQSDREQLAEIDLVLNEAEPKLELQLESRQMVDENLQAADEAMQAWQSAWDRHNECAAEPSQTAQVERTRMEHLEKNVIQLKQRQLKVDEEMKRLVGDDLTIELEQLREQSETEEMKKSEMQDKVSDVIDKIHQLRDQSQQLNRDEDELRRKLNETRGRLTSLEALQKAALGKNENAVGGWLEKHGLSNHPRLAENITVDEGWELAVETVLGSHLEAVCIEGMDSVADWLGGFEKGHLSLFDTSITAQANQVADSLLSKIKSDIPLNDILYGVKVANDLSQALAMRESLAAHESVITADGIWLAKNWLRVTRDKDEKSGVLAREHEIKALQQVLEEQDMSLEELEVNIQDARIQLQNQEQQREQWQAELNNIHSLCAQLQAQLTSGQAKLEQLLSRNQNLQEESVDLTKNIERQEDEMEVARRNRNEAMTQMEALSRERDELSGQRETLQNQLIEARDKAQNERESVHELSIQIESRRTLKHNLEQNIERMVHQLETQQQRRQELTLSLDDVTTGEDKAASLEILLEERLQVEDQLTEARRSLESIDNRLRTLEQSRSEVEQKSQLIRSSLEQARLSSSEVNVRSQTVQEQLSETDYNIEELLGELGDAAKIDEWANKVEEVAQRITRLGPINLAAIEEFEEQSERKNYLDAQNNDINEALETLEAAIAKIDKETRFKFKETFEHVNSRIQEMFPRLFGGGQAYLELTGDDLLDAGVVVMARPPGKRISHIQLMSGGEKALTAVALVFAIFELNPAPFCMLDEVDAPLDEANVGRFCALVKTMSKTVQFIFITHHKVTMEMAEKMNGVTMREPGVSRLVSVDIEEAAKMVESA